MAGRLDFSVLFVVQGFSRGLGDNNLALSFLQAVG